MDTALERINFEVENNIQWIATESYPENFEEFKHSINAPYNLALEFLANYERPLDPVQPERGEQAEFWYNYLEGISPVPPEP